MYINKEDASIIIDRTENKLIEIIGNFVTLQKKGSVSYGGTCPLCGGKHFEINPVKHVFKCFSCNELSGTRPIDFLMKGEKMSYPDSLEYLAKEIGYIINEPEKKTTEHSKRSNEYESSYCFKMLADSGLDKEDIKVNVYTKEDRSKTIERYPIRKGTMSDTGEIKPDGNDAVIEYYDLDGYPVEYDILDNKRLPTGRKRHYCRVRWQFPEEHPDKSGKPSKYKTPYGGGTPIYIPERIRQAYKSGQEISMLFIQEGEKKAEKACKHDIMSIAVSGIQNIGQNGKLPEDLIRIVERCKVKEICFLLDSDWNDLSHNIKIQESVDKRPRNFFYAVRNYKDYCRSLKARQIYVEIYFGHVNKNQNGDKGVDDLLSNSLKGKETELISDLKELLTTKELKGKHLSLYKITSATDHKLEEYWSLSSPSQFANAHKDILSNLPEFKIGKHIWKFDENGCFVSAMPIEPDEQYWEEKPQVNRQGEVYINYSFNYARCFRFLQNRGFGRYKKIDGTTAYVQLENPVVKIVEPSDIRDYITDFTKSVAGEAVLNMLYRGGSQYLGPDKLSNLEYLQPNFKTTSRTQQMLYFQNTAWKITAESIEEMDYTNIQHHIWAEQKKDFNSTKLPNLIKIRKNPTDDTFSYEITEIGKKCHFLQFLINTSNFTWRKENQIKEDILTKGFSDVTISDKEKNENTIHLIAKLCAIGYLLLEAKDRSVSRAVIAMDGKQSEVGISNGRSGKSIIGEMIKQLVPSFYLNGKNKDFTSDNFIWNDLTEGKKCCFIDDVRANFDFEFLFACLTGDWNVNYKGGARATFPFNVSPKIYLTTNHALNGDGSSFKDRQWFIAFSDFYNNTHKPIDDFGIMFFDDWDSEQWNLHWNLMAECIQAYLRYGVVEAPDDRVEIRRLRQQVGETFILWADEYYSDEKRLNTRISRRMLYDSYLEYAPEQRKFTSASAFKKKFINYCNLKGYVFNPGRIDPISGKPLYVDSDGKADMSDKSNGVEFFTIGKKPEKKEDIQTNFMNILSN